MRAAAVPRQPGDRGTKQWVRRSGSARLFGIWHPFPDPKRRIGTGSPFRSTKRKIGTGSPFRSRVRPYRHLYQAPKPKLWSLSHLTIPPLPQDSGPHSFNTPPPPGVLGPALLHSPQHHFPVSLQFLQHPTYLWVPLGSRESCEGIFP